jgi:hypothetical protein
MDPQLAEAINSAESRISFTNQQESLRARTRQSFSYFLNGGSFTISQQLISFLSTLCTLGRTSGVLLDDYDNAIRIDDIPQFLNDVVDKYFDVTNQYYMDLAKLKKTRGK